MNFHLTRAQRVLCHPLRSTTYFTKPISYFGSNSNPETLQDPDIRSWNKRIIQLIRTGRLRDAQSLFDKMPQRNTRTWNSMMSGYVKSREIWKARKLFDEMPERDRDVVSWNLIISGYFSCHGMMRYVEEGRRLFDRMPKRDLISWNTIISGYARVGRMEDALLLFNCMPERDVISWNALVTGYLQNGDSHSAIECYWKMPERDASSLSALVSGLIQNDEWDKAREILVECRKEVGNEKEDLVRAYNTLIAAYGQNGRVDEARKLFDQIPYYPHARNGERMGFERNVVSWNVMIMCYVKVGDVVSARELFDQMVVRDTFSWNTMISGYVHASDMEQAMKLFCQMESPDTLSWNTMVSGFAQCGNLESAVDFFNRTPQKNLISWNSIIAGCDKNGDYERAIRIFRQMKAKEMKPDRHTLSSILSACSGLGALDLGRQIHQQISKTVIPDITINNSLVTMYSRCGAIVEAKTIFDEMELQKDVITWNAMIGGYASHGYAATALELFEAMKRRRLQPTYITFISVLNACAHAGLVDEGRKYFASMVSDFRIEPRTEHYAALVDIIGRHGQLEEALKLIKSMPYKPDKAIWGALLGACRIHNNVELARVAADELSKLEPESSAPYILLHNMLADVEQWDDARQVRKSMEDANIRKECASSWVDDITCRDF